MTILGLEDEEKDSPSIVRGGGGSRRLECSAAAVSSTLPSTALA